MLSQALVTEVRKIEGIGAIGVAEIRQMLAQEYRRQMLGCQADQSCLAEIAGALGVDELVSYRASWWSGEQSTLSVSRIDMRRRRSSPTRSGSRAARPARRCSAWSARWSRRSTRSGRSGRGSSGASRRRWPAGWRPAAAAALGLRRDRVRRRGHPRRRGATFGLMAKSDKEELQELSDRLGHRGGPWGWQIQVAQDSLDTHAQMANSFFIAGAVLGTAAVVEGFFTDWHDYRAQVVVAPAGAESRSPERF